MVGIISYGAYIPKYRIKVDEIARVWRKNAAEISKGLGVLEKAVPEMDEDSVTLAIEAATCAISKISFAPNKLEVVLVGSESHPYAVNPTSTIVGEFLGVGNKYLAADLEFACKAGTAGMQLIAGLIEAKKVAYGLAIGTDAAQSKPHDILEYTAASGAAAFILGDKKNEVIAKISEMTSYSSDTADFWRRDGMKYPSHGGRFTGEPAYFTHVLGAARALFEKTKTKPSDFDYCIFHSPNGKFPLAAAKRLGFTKEQLMPSYIVSEIGNPYSASAMLGLSSVLDQAKPHQKIFMVSYGSGAGSDGFILETTENISVKRSTFAKASADKQGQRVAQMISQKIYIDYPEYLRRMKVI